MNSNFYRWTLQKSKIKISIEIWWQDYFTHFEMNFKIYLKNLKIQYDHLLLLWLKWQHRIFCFFICKLVLSILSALNREMNYWSCGFLSNTLNLIDLSLLSRFYIFYRLKWKLSFCFYDKDFDVDIYFVLSSTKILNSWYKQWFVRFTLLVSQWLSYSHCSMAVNLSRYLIKLCLAQSHRNLASTTLWYFVQYIRSCITTTFKIFIKLYHHWADSEFAPILNASNIYWVTLDLKWNMYICSIARDTRRMVSSLYHSRKYLAPAAMLYFY